MDDQKKAIMETAKAMIKKLEEASHQRQLNRLVKMTEITKKINQELPPSRRRRSSSKHLLHIVMFFKIYLISEKRAEKSAVICLL